MRRRAKTIERDDAVGDILRDRPQTIRVFLDFRMSCVGCPIATLHTVEDSCREHGANTHAFRSALHRATGPSNIAEIAAQRKLSFRRA